MADELEKGIADLPGFDPNDPAAQSYVEHMNMESLRSLAISAKRLADAWGKSASPPPPMPTECLLSLPEGPIHWSTEEISLLGATMGRTDPSNDHMIRTVADAVVGILRHRKG